MNIGLGIALLAAGSLAELIMLRQPTPGQRIGAIAKVCSIAYGAALYVPAEYSALVIIGYILARGGDILATGLAWAIDKFRVLRVE